MNRYSYGEGVMYEIPTFLHEPFHLLPRLFEGPFMVDVALPVRKCRDNGMVPRWIQGNGPMDEIHWQMAFTTPLLSLGISG